MKVFMVKDEEFGSYVVEAKTLRDALRAYVIWGETELGHDVSATIEQVTLLCDDPVIREVEEQA